MKKRILYHYSIISFVNIYVNIYEVGGGGEGGCGSVVHVMDNFDALPCA